MKRVIAILLTACLIVSFMPITAYADVDMTENDRNAEEAVIENITVDEEQDDEEPLAEAVIPATPSETEYDEEGVLPDGEIGDDTTLDIALATPSELEEVTEEELSKTRLFSYTDSENGVTVYLEYSCDTFGTLELPGVVVAPLETEELEAFVEEIEETEETDVMDVVAYDITFFDSDGEELEPVDGESVHVEFRNAFSEDTEDEESEISIYHIDDDGEIENVDSDSENGSVSFEAEEFSSFAAVRITPAKKVATAVLEGDELTFYYDSVHTVDHTTVFAIPEDIGDNAAWNAAKDIVTKVTFNSNFSYYCPETTSRWFIGFELLNSVDGMGYLNTQNVKNMSSMFSSCKALTAIDLSCFNTSQVTDMSYMFNLCTSLTSLNLSSFDTSNVTNMSYMFSHCNALATLDLSKFDTSNVTDMSYMFESCNALTKLDLSNFDTSSVTSMLEMFNGCIGLITIYASDSFVTTQVQNSDSMFTGCTNLKGGSGTSYAAGNPADKTYARIDKAGSPGYFTANVPKAVLVGVDGNITMTFYYDAKDHTEDQNYVIAYDIPKTNRPDQATVWAANSYGGSIRTVVFDESFRGYRPTDICQLLGGLENLSVIVDMENLNTSEVTTMNFMFADDKTLQTLDLSGFDTSKVTDMSNMFRDCNQLKTIYVDPEKFVIDQVKDDDEMFATCSKIVGGAGTTFDASDAGSGKRYAHVDGGTSNPGYFTAKNYTITLNKNGGIGGSNSVKAERDTDSEGHTIYVLPIIPQDKLPINECGIFDGYYDGTADTATKYYDKDGEQQKNWDKNADAVLYAHWIANHDLTAIAKVEPTCTTEGNNACYICNVCGGIFKDAAGTKATTEEQETLKALGHDWSDKNGICKRNGCGFTCDHNGIKSGVCPICGKNLGGGNNGYYSDDSSQRYMQGTYDGGIEGAVTGIWLYDIPSGAWSFTFTGGQKVTNSWIKAINPYATGSEPKASWFYFDANGNMLTGWQWIKDSDGITRCYYLNPLSGGLLGACWLDGRTPDGYTVNKDGAWTESGKVITR